MAPDEEDPEEELPELEDFPELPEEELPEEELPPSLEPLNTSLKKPPEDLLPVVVLVDVFPEPVLIPFGLLVVGGLLYTFILEVRGAE